MISVGAVRSGLYGWDGTHASKSKTERDKATSLANLINSALPFLTLSELTQIRLVSKQWNEASLAALTQRAAQFGFFSRFVGRYSLEEMAFFFREWMKSRKMIRYEVPVDFLVKKTEVEAIVTRLFQKFRDQSYRVDPEATLRACTTDMFPLYPQRRLIFYHSISSFPFEYTVDFPQGMLEYYYVLYARNLVSAMSLREKEALALLAVKNGVLACLMECLDAGVDLNYTGTSYSPIERHNFLHFAAWYGHKYILEQLLARGVAVDLPDGQGRAALLHAVRANRLEIAKRLIDAGADVHARNGVVLDVAFTLRNQAMVELLQAAGLSRAPRLLEDEGLDLLPFVAFNKNRHNLEVKAVYMYRDGPR